MLHQNQRTRVDVALRKLPGDGTHDQRRDRAITFLKQTLLTPQQGSLRHALYAASTQMLNEHLLPRNAPLLWREVDFWKHPLSFLGQSIQSLGFRERVTLACEMAMAAPSLLQAGQSTRMLFFAHSVLLLKHTYDPKEELGAQQQAYGLYTGFALMLTIFHANTDKIAMQYGLNTDAFAGIGATLLNALQSRSP